MLRQKYSIENPHNLPALPTLPPSPTSSLRPPLTPCTHTRWLSPRGARLQPELGPVSNGTAALLMGVSDERQCADVFRFCPSAKEPGARAVPVSPPLRFKVSQSPHTHTHAHTQRENKAGEVERERGWRKKSSLTTHTHSHTRAHVRGAVIKCLCFVVSARVHLPR